MKIQLGNIFTIKNTNFRKGAFMDNKNCDKNLILFPCFILIYLELMILLLSFIHYVESLNAMTVGYILLLVIVYPLVYLLPTIAIAFGLRWLLFPKGLQNKTGWRLRFFYSILTGITCITILFIFFDYQLYSLYEYHVNSFVLNLITTSGGIDSIGATRSTKVSYALMAAGLASVNVFIFFIGSRLAKRFDLSTFSRRWTVKILIVFIVLLGSEEIIHGFAYLRHMDSCLQVSSTVPLHLGLKFNTLATKLGLQRSANQVLTIKSGRVIYPLQPVCFESAQKPKNIVWLTVESLRWDMLDPEIMPNLWEFSRRALNFNRHYSGGNRTRMGMFTMFYGLYPNYWYPFERQAIGPVIMDALLQQNYQMTVNTSQSFTYPELYRTVFAKVPRKFMHELKDQSIPAWRRDELNISSILNFLDTRKKERPFFAFMFFESTHAPYSFTNKGRIRPDYLRDMNYAHLKLLTGINRIKNRYINAAHCVDRQVGRVLAYLKGHRLLDNTIVLLTGDHGEEFMEHGHWGHGHNAAFPEQQVHVPLVLWLPGMKSREINTPTSHIDIPGTIASLIGIHNDVKKFSQGAASLLDRREKFQVFGNYSYMGYMDARYKIIYPFRDYPYFYYRVTGADDHIVAKEEKNKVLGEYQGILNQLKVDAEKYIHHS
jgi:membrane-anchored protein YejM (alkaline phosphatase superfamily)